MKISFVVVAACLAFGLVSTAARADLAPPSGQKRISYSFSAHVSGDTSSQVVFSYPCSGSNGAPARKVTPLGAKTTVSIGNHESCQIYAVAKDTYDAWAKDAGANPDAAGDGLVAQAKPCSGKGPAAIRQVASTDPRDSVSDDIDITLDKTSCTMTTRPQATVATPAPSASSSAAPAKKQDCNASGSSTFPLLLALPALVLLLKKRRG